MHQDTIATLFTEDQIEAIRALARREARKTIRKEFANMIRPALTQVHDELRMTLPNALKPMIRPIMSIVERVMAEFVRNASTEE